MNGCSNDLMSNVYYVCRSAICCGFLENITCSAPCILAGDAPHSGINWIQNCCFSGSSPALHKLWLTLVSLLLAWVMDGVIQHSNSSRQDAWRAGRSRKSSPPPLQEDSWLNILPSSFNAITFYRQQDHICLFSLRLISQKGGVNY